jgi:phage FluMu protein Com
MATINCPHCNTSLNLPENAVGKIVKCTRCNERFQASAPQAVAVAATPSASVSAPMVPTGVPSPSSQTATVAVPSLVCLSCGYQGRMPKKFPTWIIVCAILLFPFGLVLLCMPKKFKCPQCGTFQD